MPLTIVFAHGFISSPQSAKAALLRDHLKQCHPHIVLEAPWLPGKPSEAFGILKTIVEEQKPIGIVGSSMGGFYASVLTEAFGIPSVLVNPVVEPTNIAHHFLGKHHNPYSGTDFQIHQSDIDDLAAMTPASLTQPSKYWLLAQKGDETLDYRDAAQVYSGCKQTLEQGGHHQFEGFERFLPAIIDFFQNTNAA